MNKKQLELERWRVILVKIINEKASRIEKRKGYISQN